MMTVTEVLKHEAELAYADLLEALDGVTQNQSWAVLPEMGSDYLHTDGSIHGITFHIASCKFMYGSVAFKSGELRWRDCADEVEKFEPSWSSALEYLQRSQDYWMNSWKNLKDQDLENEVPHFRGNLWPVWKIIRMMIYHDAYHCGQIAMLRYACKETDTPPPSAAEDIRKSCSELPNW